MENVKINISAGGVFSKFMFGIQNAEALNPEISNFYFNNVDNRAKSNNFSQNPFDFVINQNYNNNYIDFNAIHLGNYSKFNPIEHSNKLNNFKKIITKIKLTDKLSNLVKDYEKQIQFTQNTVGIHIRLCDMNIVHGKDYGVLQYQDFDNCLKQTINEKSKIFVASDNMQSIEKLKEQYGDRIFYIPNMIRASTEVEDTTHFQEKLLGSESIWLESFLEMLLLSKCQTLICRSSNLANASIIFSNTMEKVIRL